MANQGGPNEIGAVSVGVTADLSQLAQDMQGAAPIAEKAGEEAGKAFSKGVEKGAAESKTGKWMGEGSDGFVGPARPTGKDEAARQWALAQEQAASNAGGSAGAAEGGAVGAVGVGGGGGLGAMAAQAAAISAMIVAAEKVAQSAYEIGKAIGDALAQTQKQQLELTQALRQASAAISSEQGGRASQYGKVSGANPLVGDGVLKTAADLESEVFDLEKKRTDVDNNRGRRAVDALLSGPMGPVKMAITGFSDAAEVSALDAQIAQDKDRLDRPGGLRDQVSSVMANQRANFTVGGLLSEADDAAGIAHRTIPATQSLDAVGAAKMRERYARMSHEELVKQTTILTETNPERANRIVNMRGQK